MTGARHREEAPGRTYATVKWTLGLFAAASCRHKSEARDAARGSAAIGGRCAAIAKGPVMPLASSVGSPVHSGARREKHGQATEGAGRAADSVARTARSDFGGDGDGGQAHRRPADHGRKPAGLTGILERGVEWVQYTAAGLLSGAPAD